MEKAPGRYQFRVQYSYEYDVRRRVWVPLIDSRYAIVKWIFGACKRKHIRTRTVSGNVALMWTHDNPFSLADEHVDQVRQNVTSTLRAYANVRVNVACVERVDTRDPQGFKTSLIRRE
jgi:hypothetical protein